MMGLVGVKVQAPVPERKKECGVVKGGRAVKGDKMKKVVPCSIQFVNL